MEVVRGQQDTHVVKNEAQSLYHTWQKNVNSRWIAYLNVKDKNIKFVEDNVRENIYDPG